MSTEVASEIYPVAVQQARQGVLMDIGAAIVVAIVAATMWASGFPGAWCLIFSALLGGPAIVSGLFRWKRLRRMHPLDAAARGEL